MDGVVFDKDGTLIDFQHTWEPTIRKCASFAANGDALIADKILRHCGMDPKTGVTSADSIFAVSNTSEIAQAMIACGSTIELSALTNALDDFSRATAHNAVSLFDLPSLFQTLQNQGVKIGIASSDNEASIRSTADALGIAHLVDFIAGYDSGYGVKPSGGMVRAFCRTTNCAAKRVMVVGDNHHDMAMGKDAKAGMLVGVLTGTGTRETLAEFADYILDDLGGLLELVGQS